MFGILIIVLSVKKKRMEEVKVFNEFDREEDNFEVFRFEYEQTKVFQGLKWDISDMQKEKFRERSRRNPSFLRVFNPKYNLTKPMSKEFRYRTIGERNIIVEITGVTGIGKSLVAVTIAVEWMSKLITADDIAFTTDELLQRSMQIGKNHTLIQDEQINQLGAGSQREDYERQSLEDTTRKFGLNIIFCSPTTRNHSTAHYQLEVVCRNDKKRLTKVAILSGGGTYLGYFIIKVLEEDNPLWVDYSERKDEFIKTIMSRKTKRLSLDEMALSLREHEQFAYAKTREQKKVVASKMFPTLTIQEITMIVENLQMLEQMGK